MKYKKISVDIVMTACIELVDLGNMDEDSGSSWIQTMTTGYTECPPKKLQSDFQHQ